MASWLQHPRRRTNGSRDGNRKGKGADVGPKLSVRQTRSRGRTLNSMPTVIKRSDV